MLVINLFGAPGAGKSTGAAYIFAMLKMAGIKCELVTEFAKDKVYEETKEVWNNQQYIFGKQSFRMGRLKDKVKVVITDSPLVLSALYNEDDVLGSQFDNVVLNVFNQYHNINYFVNRTKPYNPDGRHQTEIESDALAFVFKKELAKFNVYYDNISGDMEGYDFVVNDVLNYLEEQRC